MVLLPLGCGSSFDSSVSGTVKQAGQPLTKGNVSFHPVGGGPIAVGDIHRDGTYSVKTGTGEGLPPGEYKVTIVATDPPPPGDEETPGALLTPPEYGNAKTTPLTRMVAPGANTIDLEVPALE